MTGLLEGKRILITGAAAGIGLGIAKECAAAGASLIVADIDYERLVERAAEFDASADSLQTVALDVGRRESIHRLFDSMDHRLDGLVNNAGKTIEGDFLEFDDDDLDCLWRTNLRAGFLMCQHAARHMVRHGGGAIVNIASNHSSASTPGYEMYAATKAGIAAMTRAMSWSLGPHQIRVNTLSPGLTGTEAVTELVQRHPTLGESFNRLHADGRYATVREIGKIAAFLLSDHAAAITGSEIVADHGLQALLCQTGDLKAPDT